MKKRISQKNIKPVLRNSSSVRPKLSKQLSSDSTKLLKRKISRKNRKFGDDITNQQKNSTSSMMEQELVQVQLNQSKTKMPEVQPYLFEIGEHIRKLDSSYNISIAEKMLTRSPDSTEITLEMRKVLLKWIMQVAQKFKAKSETVHLCVQIIDFILVYSHQKVTKSNFQLLGISALFVASKYNEIYTPDSQKYVYVCDGLYTLENLFQMESYILTLTNFNLQFPTVYQFTGPLTNDSTIGQNFKKTINQICQISIMDFNLFNKYKKIHLSAVIIYLTAKIMNLNKFNSKMLMEQMNIDPQTFKECLSLLVGVYRQYGRPAVQNRPIDN